MNDATMIKSQTVTAASRTPAEAIESRRSIRAYLTDPVSSELVRQVLELASHAPSGSNLQPWKVHVLLGETLSQVGRALSAAFIGTKRVTSGITNTIPTRFSSLSLPAGEHAGWGFTTPSESFAIRRIA